MAHPIDHLKALEQRLLWLASWTVHNANHLREKRDDDVKVGGHQASCASMVSIEGESILPVFSYVAWSSR